MCAAFLGSFLTFCLAEEEPLVIGKLEELDEDELVTCPDIAHTSDSASGLSFTGPRSGPRAAGSCFCPESQTRQTITKSSSHAKDCVQDNN